MKAMAGVTVWLLLVLVAAGLSSLGVGYAIAFLAIVAPVVMIVLFPAKPIGPAAEPIPSITKSPDPAVATRVTWILVAVALAALGLLVANQLYEFTVSLGKGY